MRTKLKRTLCGAALALGGLTAHAQGLEGIIVEEYYTLTAADAAYLSGVGTYPINAGAKVYRIYVDMAPNYKLNTVNGSPLPVGGGPSPNPLDFTTTTTFWNEDGFGSEVPPQSARFDDGASFDSYITIGTTGRSGGAAGCGTNTQQVGTLKTADTNGNLTLCSVYEGFPSGAGTPDGNIPGTVPALTYNLGGLIDFSALTANGSSFTVVGDAWATLPNGTGVDPTGTNRVLIAQLTTDGTLTFHINVQLQAPGGALETYVWNQAGSGEQVKTFLTFPAPPAPDCLGVLGGPAVPGTACNDNNACTLNDVWSPACVCAGVLPAANWDMATAAPNANTISNTTIGDISVGNNNGTTTLITSTSASSGYTGATGTNNAGAAAFTGALNTATSTYFEFTLTPNAGTIFTLNGLSFGTRSTGTGAQAYTVRTSADGFVANVATGSIANNSVWSLKSNTGLSVASLNGQPLTVRIYGHNGSGSPSANTANWRIDDLNVQGCNTVVPCVPASITTATSNSPICASATLNLNATATGDAPLSFVWSGVGTISNGNTASASVTGAATGLYTVIVTNACGADTQTVSVTVDALLTYYADVDGDGFGDPAVDSLSCTLPVGYVTNNTDNCPAVPGVIGSTCNDGNPNTNNDVLDASCACVGTPATAITGCSSSQSPYLKP
ncbi:MAG: hypothetical protein JNM91_04655, partial [Flavobacteriales bacterium]|nr:hypothetical protein [Flavobacteriales bacterium]